MITFLSLFLSLLAGPQWAEVAVDPSVVRVEFWLDGAKVASLNSPPWRVRVDLGPSLAPHRLEAVAFGGREEEVERVEQWINLPRPRTEMKWVLGRNHWPPKTAKLVWKSLDVEKSHAIRITLDGEPLTLDSSGNVALPELDPSRSHLLQAVMEVDSKVFSAEALVGKRFLDQTSAHLTAIPVYWLKKGMPKDGELKNSFSRRGKKLEVVMIERPSFDIVVVQDQSLRFQRELWRVRRDMGAKSTWGRISNRLVGLRPSDRLWVIFPQRSQAGAGLSVDLFPVTPNLVFGKSSRVLKEGILAVMPLSPKKETIPIHRLSDAVAVAGRRANAGQRARVVILMLGRDTEDWSRHSPESVTGYLELLRVPLMVWSPSNLDQEESPWPGVKSIRNRNGLSSEIKRMQSLLDSQLMVWVEGRHPLHEVRLTPQAPSGMRMVGSP